MKGFQRARPEGRIGLSHADVTRIRNLQLDSFTIDRLMTVHNNLGLTPQSDQSSKKT